VSDRIALLQNVIAHPDEDAPRLVFADWLDEHGEADRAAFIRLQVARHLRFTADPFDAFKMGFVRWRYAKDGLRAGLDAYHAALAAEDALQKPHRAEWRKEVPSRIAHMTFHRGFISQCEIRVSGFVTAPASLWRRSPVRSLDFRVGRGGLGLLPDVPELDRLVAVEFRATELGDAEVGRLVVSPHLAGLRQLGLPLNGIAATALRRLAEAGPRGLTVLNLNGNWFGVAGLHALAEAPFLGTLTALGLNRNGLGDEGAAILAALPQLGGLRVLELVGNGIGDAGARALAESPSLGGLAALGLGENPISSIGRAALEARFGPAADFTPR
jgi:uncharacterized protein (TIGR02996 family)